MNQKIINVSLKNVISQLLKMKFLTFMAVFSIIIWSISFTFSTFLSSYLINSLFNNFENTQTYTLLFGLALAIVIISSLLKSFILNRIWEKLTNLIIEQFLFNSTLNNNISWNSVNNESKLAIIGQNIGQIVQVYHLQLFSFFSSIIFLMTSLIALGLLLPIAFSYVVPFILILIIGQITMLALYSKIGKIENETSQSSTRSIIKAFDNFLFIKRNNFALNNAQFFSRSQKNILKLQNKAAKIISIIIFINVGANGVLMGISLFLTVLAAIGQGEVTFGQIVTIFTIATAIFSQTIDITNIFGTISSGKSQFKEISLLIKNVNYQILNLKSLSKISLSFNLNSKPSRKYEIKNGDKILIYGANGAGKSLLLKHISGNPLIENLEILIDNQKIDNGDIFDLHKHFYYNSNLNYFEKLTIRRNLDFQKINNLDKLNYLIEKFNLSHLDLDAIWGDKNLQLSEGEKQRLEIIRTLLSTKDFLVFDESFANIDVQNKNIIYDYLLTKEKRTVFIVAHDFNQKMYNNQIDHFINLNEIKLITKEQKC